VKDGLAAYRNITQSSNVSSLETVLKYYLETVEKNFNTAIKNVSNHSDYLKEIEDEENPEDVFLNTLEDKIDSLKEDVSRKWKMLMEAYRNELELIYKNKKLEDMYCHVAKKAMKQCKKFNKRSDFKRLCEVIRMHQYQNVKAGEKTSNMTGFTFSLNIKDDETNDRLIDLRFTQLESAKEMNLWQDSYRIIEDINVLLKNRRKTSIDLLTKYYQQLYQIFWKSNHYLLHAVSLHSYFACLRKKSDEKEQVKFVNQLILASLSIPKGNIEEMNNIDVFRKNALLINSSGQIMNRQQLLANLKNGTYLDLCNPEVREIFVLMTDCKDILQFSKKVENIFSKLKESPEFHKYLPLIEQNIIANLIEKLSTLYKSMSFATFKKVLGFLDFSKCEKYLLYHQSADGGRAQIDYQKGMLIFAHDTAFGERIASSLATFVNDVAVANRYLLRVQMTASNEHVTLEKQSVINARRLLEEAEEETRRKREEGSKATMSANLIIQQRDEILNQRIKEDEEKKQLLKQERKFQEVDQKTLIIFSERVKNILKLDKNASYKGKKLDAFTESDYLGMTIDVLIDIENDIKAKKQRQEEDKLEKQFKNRDYLERMIRKKRLDVLLKKRESSTIDLDEQKAIAKAAHEVKLQAKEQLKGVAGFVKSFKDRLDANRLQVYNKQQAEYRKTIAEAFAETVFKNATKKKQDDEEKQKKEQEQRQSMADHIALNNPAGATPSKPIIVGLTGRSNMTSAELQGSQPQPTAPGLSRGTGGATATEGPSAEPKKLARGTQRRDDLIQSQPTPAEKPEETSKKSELAKVFEEPAQPSTTGRLFRGTGVPAAGSLLQKAPITTTTTTTTTTAPAPTATGPGPLISRGTIPAPTKVEKPEEPAPAKQGRSFGGGLTATPTNPAPANPTPPANPPATQKPPERKGRAFG
jgi:translation initiation factor 3 subunit A